jgi:hypothetical protein
MIAVLTGLAALATANAGALAVGAPVGAAIEMALPWIARARRVRQASRLVNKVARHCGRTLQPYEREKFVREVE